MIVNNNTSATAGAGTHTYAYNGGLTLNSGATFDASGNNPAVVVTTVTAVGPTAGLFKMGSGLWQVSNNWNVTGTVISQAAGGILRFNGTGLQNVYSSSNTYFQIDDANTSSSGVQFDDSLTVSTFTALQAGTTIEFQIKPSSLTVTGYLGIGGPALGSRVGLRSISTGTRWGLVLSTGATQNVLSVDAKDSDASGMDHHDPGQRRQQL